MTSFFGNFVIASEIISQMFHFLFFSYFFLAPQTLKIKKQTLKIKMLESNIPGGGFQDKIASRTTGLLSTIFRETFNLR